MLLIFLAACARIPIENNLPPEAYFCNRDNCTSTLAGLISNAREAKCALYDVSQPEILDALENADWVRDDGKGPLMHNKFCVINRSTVWTGSFNPTRTSKANNAVIIHSSVVAQNYLAEFDELKRNGSRRVLYPRISLNNRLVENYFCPEDDCKRNTLRLLGAARHGIIFMLADLTDKGIIRELQQTGIRVEGIIDRAEHNALEQLPFAKNGSIHHKVFIIDGNTVITGSANPTFNGYERNDENIIVFHDVAMAKKFLEEYNYLIS
jgi:phosphatidylserine/phosphatidylglycerophosphate/cardiolipin synthase-like enzyme